MPAKKPEVTPFSSPRERFQSVDLAVRAHHDMVDKPSFNAGADSALAQYVTNQIQGIHDLNSAAACGFRIQGAVDFLSLFKTLAEIPKPGTPESVPGQLLNTDSPRRV
jgi:hypothetical protein